MIDFYKYQGAGNDFILIDNRNKVVKGDKVLLAQKWCDRRFGIGSDGLIFIEEDNEAEFEMDFYNPDGSQSFCGNGSRCAVAFVKKLGAINSKVTFKAIDGIHKAEFEGDQVKIAMHQFGGIKSINNDHFIDTGSPHYIAYHQKENYLDIVDFGKEIRYSEQFKAKGTNVNLIEKLSENHIAVRTYERGVEDETLACGTGATACGLSYASQHDLNKGVVNVDVQGGKLKIHFEKTIEEGVFTNIWLEGPATFVFKGEING